MIIDHIDNNQDNNHISNLQLLTPQENLLKDKPKGYGTGNNTVKLCKKLTEEEILNKINYYIELNNSAIKRHDAKAAHKYRSQISQWRGKFKKFKEFQRTEEYKKIMEYKALLKELEEAKKEYNAWRIWTLEASNKWHDSKNKDDKYKYESAKLMLEGCKAKVKALKNEIKDLK